MSAHTLSASALLVSAGDQTVGAVAVARRYVARLQRGERAAVLVAQRKPAHAQSVERRSGAELDGCICRTGVTSARRT
jgi:hypothetical protein